MDSKPIKSGSFTNCKGKPEYIAHYHLAKTDRDAIDLAYRLASGRVINQHYSGQHVTVVKSIESGDFFEVERASD